MYRFHPCTCAPGGMARIHRSGWMRLLFPQRALFECGSCGGQFLANVAQQADMALRAQADRLQSRHAVIQEETASSVT